MNQWRSTKSGASVIKNGSVRAILNFERLTEFPFGSVGLYPTDCAMLRSKKDTDMFISGFHGVKALTEQACALITNHD